MRWSIASNRKGTKTRQYLGNVYASYQFSEFGLCWALKRLGWKDAYQWYYTLTRCSWCLWSARQSSQLLICCVILPFVCGHLAPKHINFGVSFWFHIKDLCLSVNFKPYSWGCYANEAFWWPWVGVKNCATKTVLFTSHGNEFPICLLPCLALTLVRHLMAWQRFFSTWICKINLSCMDPFCSYLLIPKERKNHFVRVGIEPRSSCFTSDHSNH